MDEKLDKLIRLLIDNGISLNRIGDWFCCTELELDFSEHDKVFEDKISQLEKDIASYKQAFEDKCSDLKSTSDLLEKSINKNEELEQRIAELESKETVDLPFDPLECANYLINATYERETNGIERTFRNLPEKINSDRYTVDELEQIAEHLLVYCKYNKESE